MRGGTFRRELLYGVVLGRRREPIQLRGPFYRFILGDIGKGMTCGGRSFTQSMKEEEWVY